MQKVVATRFDAPTWEKYGLSWTRAAKSTGNTCLVIDAGLPGTAKEKLSELKFRLIPQGEARTGHYADLVTNMKEDERCLFCPADYDFKSPGLDSLFGGAGLVCVCDGGLPLPNMVLPIANIGKRATAARLLEEKVISVHGSPLDTRLMCGDKRSWTEFVGYYDFLLQSAYLEPRWTVDRIALNLYAAFFPGRVTTV